MTFIEMVLSDTTASVMISPAHISEVVEMGENVKLHMASGNTYEIVGQTFAAALNAVEGAKYLKITAPEAAEEVKEVEGEYVPAKECCI